MLYFEIFLAFLISRWQRSSHGTYTVHLLRPTRSGFNIRGTNIQHSFPATFMDNMLKMTVCYLHLVPCDIFYL